MLVNQNHVGLEVGGKCDGLRLAGVDVQQQAFGGNGCPEAKRSIHRLPMAAAMAARAWGMGWAFSSAATAVGIQSWGN